MTEGPFVLTSASKITCDSAGEAVLTGDAKLTVGGSAVVLRLNDLLGKTISGCQVKTNTNTGTLTCSTLDAATGPPTKLTIGRLPVALDTVSVIGKGIHTPPTLAPLSVTAGQEKLRTR